MFQIDLTRLLAQIGDVWHRRSTILTLILLVPLFLLVLFGQVDFNKLTRYHFAFILLSTLAVLALWLISRRAPTTPASHVGFIIAMVSENSDHAKQIRSDFIEQVRRLLVSERTSNPFVLLEYPAYLSSHVHGIDDARAALRRSRAHFILYGSARIRHIQGQERHVLYLDGAVVHRTTTTEIQRNLSSEFSELLPRQVIFERENDVFSFQFTSQWTEIVSRYIIGIAAAISGDPNYAEELYQSVQTRLSVSAELPPPLRKIRDRLPYRIMEILDYRVLSSYQQWWVTRDLRHLRDAESQLDRLDTLAPNLYSSHLTRAICHFVLRRDLAAAKRTIRQCKSEEDATWRYSDAFLSAYEGHLTQADRYYRAAFRKPCHPSVPIQSEEFLNEVLAQEPDKYQLLYCAGLINHFAKVDYAASIREFGRFLQQGDGLKYARERSLARQYILDAHSALSGNGVEAR